MLGFLNVNGWEYMIIAVVALVVVGPEELPTVLRKVGAYLRQFRDMGDKMRGEFMDGMNELDPTTWHGTGAENDPIVPRGYAKEVSAGGPMDRGVVKTDSELAAEQAAAASAAALAKAAPTDPWGRPIDPRLDETTGESGADESSAGDETTGENGAGGEATGESGAGDEATGGETTDESGADENGAENAGESGAGESGAGDEAAGEGGAGESSADESGAESAGEQPAGVANDAQVDERTSETPDGDAGNETTVEADNA